MGKKKKREKSKEKKRVQMEKCLKSLKQPKTKETDSKLRATLGVDIRMKKVELIQWRVPTRPKY